MLSKRAITGVVGIFLVIGAALGNYIPKWFGIGESDDPAIEQIRKAQVQHGIQDMIVVVERTGNYYLPPKRAFAKAGFEVRVLHPFATKQFRQPADPGNKTDETDLYAQHRAAVERRHGVVDVCVGRC